MVTLQHIADKVKMSRATVCLALKKGSENTRLSKATCKKIQDIANELGYQPSLAGKMLKTGRTNILSVIVPDLADPFYSKYISSFKHTAAQDGMDIVVYDYELDPEQEKRYLERMLTGNCDGSAAFISSFQHTSSIIRKLWDAKIPLVTIGTPSEFDIDLNYDLITTKDDALETILKYLKTQKRKNIVWGVSKIPEQSIQILKKKYSDFFQKYGFSYQENNFVYLPTSSGNQAADGKQIGHKIFQNFPEADTVLLWNGFQVYGFIKAAFEEGKRIPEDITVIVRDNTWISQYSCVPMYSIDQQIEQYASESYRLIKKRLENKQWGVSERIKIASKAVFPDSEPAPRRC